jgi:hypothetical protein
VAISAGIKSSQGCWPCLDDDSFQKELSAPLGSHSKWEKELTLELANSGHGCFIEAAECAIAQSEDLKDLDVKPNKKDDTTSVAIRVQCQNIDWDKLTSTEKNFVGLNLGRAFNHVSGEKTQLKDMEWESTPSQTASLVDFLLEISSGGRLGISHFNGVLHKDATNDEEGGRHLQGCWPCLDDDSYLRGHTNDIEIAKLWESQLEYFLHEGPYSSLSRADDCQIEMDVANALNIGAQNIRYAPP